MAKMLLAWELGGGLGHVVRFERLAAELVGRGHEVSLSFPHALPAARFTVNGHHVRLCPPWPGITRMRRSGRRDDGWITYGDMLADLLFSSDDEIAGHLRMWRGIFAAERPDVVIADYAPGAVLAARGHLPLVNIGDGYTLPPHDMASFPRLWPTSDLRHDEAEVAIRINSALSQIGAPPLANYPDMNAATDHATMTIPLLDVYRERRSGGWLGLGPFRPSGIPTEARSGLYFYLRENAQFDARLIQGAAESGLGGLSAIPNLLRRNRKLLREAGFEAPEELPSLDENLDRFRILLHPGGMGTAIAGVAKGVPQLIIYSDLDKYHIGAAISAAGAGIALDHRTVTKGEITEAIHALARDPAFTRRALELAEENHALLRTSSIAALAERAIGLKPDTR